MKKLPETLCQDAETRIKVKVDVVKVSRISLRRFSKLDFSIDSNLNGCRVFRSCSWSIAAYVVGIAAQV